MPKVTNEDVIKEKLDYIGLNLEKIPEFFKKPINIEYSPIKAYEENGYKVYKYIPISKIQILLTPSNRMNTIKEKYSKASNLISYLLPEKEENIIRYTTFLKMLKTVKIEEIEEVGEEQKKLSKQIPFKVKFEENYLWQIYYSDIQDIYFMLVPTNDLEYATFFYLLKKQIEYSKTKKEEMIFVPICYENYSNKYLKNLEISDIEKYLWFFTKHWPNIYEVFDKKGDLTIQIIGETFVYEGISSVYKIKLENKEEAIKFYKVLKALFILSTELPHYYKFTVKIDRYGYLEFRYNNKKITYDTMLLMMNNEYDKAKNEIMKLGKDQIQMETELEELKIISKERDEEYLLKEKQIATYLECRKTFFGRVKYFFKAKKMKKNLKEEKIEKEKSKIEIKKDIPKMNFVKREYYTIEDIIKIYKELDEIRLKVKNLTLDTKALKSKIENMETKIKNANLYIQEIDKHEKSIFEFWKFANKDEKLMLNEAINEDTISSKKIQKVYNYEEDLEEIGMLVDKKQRTIFTKQDLDYIYISSTEILSILNNINNEDILKNSLENLKNEFQKQRILFSSNKPDIFGDVQEDSTKILGNKKHRENLKDKLKILDINNNTSLEEYKDKLNKVLINVNNCLNKKKELPIIPIYLASTTEDNLKGLKTVNINPEKAIKECEDSSQINLYKINMDENTKIIYFSNCIYYDNDNKTLPLGMDVATKGLINLEGYEIKEIYKDDFRINTEVNEFKFTTQKINLYEIELNIKEK